MSVIKSRIAVIFEEPFWVVLYERQRGKNYEVCKVTFGAEPKDSQVYEYLLKNWSHLKFSSPIYCDEICERKINPKRLLRQVRRETENVSVGTKAQQALKIQYEQNKTQRKICSREMKELRKKRQFSLRCEKRRQKHKGH